MSLAISAAVLGIASGAIYVLLALGIVLIHRGSGTINFAQGAVAMVGTFLFWKLDYGWHWPYGLALLAGVAFAAAIGIAVNLFVMTPLRNASPIARLIASLGVLAILEESMALIYQGPPIIVPSQLPTTSVRIFGVGVGLDLVIIFAIVIVLAGILGVIYRWTQFGRATSAVAENRDFAAALGWSPAVIASANWGMGCALAGLAGILLAPITGLSVTAYTLLVVPALAAAIVGKLASFPLTLIGGLVIGIAQAEVGQYVSSPGWSDIVPFLAIIIIIIARGTAGSLRTSVATRLPEVGSGRIRPWAVGIFAVGSCLIALLAAGGPWQTALIATFGTGIIVLSVVLITGYSGQLCLAQFAFAGWGVWIAAGLSSYYHLPFLVCALCGIAATVPLAAIIGVICLRTRGVDLAVATLGVAVVLNSLVFSNSLRTNADLFEVRPPSIGPISLDPYEYLNRYAILVILVFCLIAIGIANIRRSQTGRRMLSVRSNEKAAASVGIAVTRIKVTAFIYGGVVAAAGGIVLAFSSTNVTFDAYNPTASIQVIGYAVIGGIGWVASGIFGGLLDPGGLASQVVNLFGNSVGDYVPVAGGVLLILTLLAAPDGVAKQVTMQVQGLARLMRLPESRRRRAQVNDQLLVPPDVPVPSQGLVALAPARTAGQAGVERIASDPARESSRPAGPHRDGADPASSGSRPARSDHSHAVTDAAQVPSSHPLLETRNVGVSFGGVRALADVDMTVAAGEIVGVIGPNGAGKTTLIDAMTGFVRVSQGQILWEGSDITRLTPIKRVKVGLARSFQSLELFDDLTVMDNIRAASEAYRPLGALRDVVHPVRPPLSGRAEMAISDFHLEEYLRKRPGELPYGRRRLVAIARCVATGAQVLALDEPAAGLAQSEVEELCELINQLSRRWGMGILVIEHNVEMVMSLCDRVYALNFGKVMSSGTPEEVRGDPEVISAYLGSD
jgi:ABC-type branched-subunit amino acid transport system ATPase component/branched-subunit amino acid ABC-type transport system permease component